MIATLVVFERWIKAIPGGLVAVVGAIVVSYVLDLSAHGVSDPRAGPERSAARSALPAGVTTENAIALLPTAVSMFLVILAQSAATSRAYAVKYQEQFVENNDLVGLGLANLGGRPHAAPSWSTAARRRPRWSTRRRAKRSSPS